VKTSNWSRFCRRAFMAISHWRSSCNM